MPGVGEVSMQPSIWATRGSQWAIIWSMIAATRSGGRRCAKYISNRNSERTLWRGAVVISSSVSTRCPAAVRL